MKPKILSIRQPWCHHILHDGKDVENRSWPTRYRGRFLLHSSKTFDGHKTESEGFQMGGIVGMADIIDCVTEMDSEWFCGNFGFVLANAQLLPFTSLRGRLGFFDPPPEFWETPAGREALGGAGI